MTDNINTTGDISDERVVDFNRGWIFYPGAFDLFHSQNPGNTGYRTINLPHDYMIEGNVSPDAAAGPAMGFYNGSSASYTKKVTISSEYEDELIYLYFDGVMGYASLNINGAFVTNHHYGYTPFYTDITPYIDYDCVNRITVNVNASMQPSSRWYSGAGIYRNVKLIRVPRLHIIPDGIYIHTDRIVYDNNVPEKAYIIAEVTISNNTDRRRIAGVSVDAVSRTDSCNKASGSGQISIEPFSRTTARIRMTFDAPLLWDDLNPELYDVNVNMTEQGIFTTHLIPAVKPMHDEDSTVFGIRTITADSDNGLCINNRKVKLKGGCIHHDNGILGAVSLYDSEYRKILIHKKGGFNAIRSAHNPPSAELLRVCDELGIYVIDEAFDCFETAKLTGDYSQNFKDYWREDIEAFMMRDRNHPSIIIWSTGNEIPERGGLGNGYELAGELAEHMRKYDRSRLITNAFCSFWSGLCDREQNDNPSDKDPEFMERRSEPFVNNLDIVGYNYLDNNYENTVKNYPERVIVGTESFPRYIDTIWDNVMRYPAVIGDFTWTSYDYIGEAGIGKSFFYEKGNEAARKEAERLTASSESEYPWRLANDADYDINGNITPQGCYRKVVWGSDDTYIFTTDPVYYGKEELISLWGFGNMQPVWDYPGHEGDIIKVKVFSRAEYVELYYEDVLVGKEKCGSSVHYIAEYEVEYREGKLTAISYDKDGREISKKTLVTPGKPVAIKLTSDKKILCPDGVSLSYVMAEIIDENSNIIRNKNIKMSAVVEGDAYLQGFGSANPITEENYTTGEFTSYNGSTLAVIRAGYTPGKAVLRIRAEGLKEEKVEIVIQCTQYDNLLNRLS